MDVTEESASPAVLVCVGPDLGRGLLGLEIGAAATKVAPYTKPPESGWPVRENGACRAQLGHGTFPALPRGTAR